VKAVTVPNVGDDLGAGIAAMKLFKRPVVAGGKPDIELEAVPTGPQALRGAGYSRLANECFLLAAISVPTYYRRFSRGSKQPYRVSK
jgi:hypothetical protein